MNAKTADLELTFNERMRIKLLELKREILNSLMNENEELQEIADSSKTPTDSAEIAGNDIDKKILETLGVRDLNRLNLIDAALGRIENGSYGRCLKSGKPIARERLEAIPYALYTVEVQQALDKKRRYA